ncbi:MAG: TonB-dependent receptor [Phocaeicola sp.]|uniref:TonB-dependent receptor n=1 Tax=Phocaeicola sp. TaxID=2773926 RepID=UPI003F9FBA31
MKRYNLLLLILISFTSFQIKAQNVVISGFVLEKSSHSPLIGANVYSESEQYGSITDKDGHFKFKMPQGRVVLLKVSYVGYETQAQQINTNQNVEVNFYLSQHNQISEVEVLGHSKDFGITNSQMGAINLPIHQVKLTPTLFGEADVLKTLQKLPGVQAGSEGNAGFMVRGGDYDQNLINIDGATLYNAEHLRGYVSAVNPDIIDGVVLYKGAFPAQYGERLSGVVDMRVKEGDLHHYHGEIGIGVLSSKLRMEGPLWKNHTSFNIAARASYFNWIVQPALKSVYDDKDALKAYAHMNYWDINAKLVHRFGDADKLSAVFYLGRDVNNNSPSSSQYNAQIDQGKKLINTDNSRSNSSDNNWGNIIGSLIWNHTFNTMANLKTALNYSEYNYRLTYQTNETAQSSFFNSDDEWELFSSYKDHTNIKFKSGIHDLALTSDLTWTPHRKHKVDMGIQAAIRRFYPIIESSRSLYKKTLNPNWDKIDEEKKYIEEQSDKNQQTGGREDMFSASIYGQDDAELTHFLKVNFGVRATLYSISEKSELCVEPRISLRWLLNDKMAMKLGYSRMSQGLHQLSSGNLSVPSDLWVPMTKDLDVSLSDLFSLGYYHNLTDHIQLSVEGYYKKMSNLLEYREGASYLRGNANWSELVAQGKGRSYGIELLLQKSKGNTTGWISYAWIRSLRTFDNPGMEISGGREFKASTDRPHNFNIVVSHQMGKHWDFSLSWTYQSGRRGTLSNISFYGGLLDEYNSWAYHYEGGALGAYLPLGMHGLNRRYSPYDESYAYLRKYVRVASYKERNGYKLPDVHRLDVSLNYHINHGWGESICNLSIYNVYNHQNISNVYVGYDNNRMVLKGICLFPLIPSVSYTLKF